MFVELIQFLLTLIMATVGYWVARAFGDLVTPTYPGALGYSLFIILFAGIGYLGGGWAARRLGRAVRILDEALAALPGIDLIVGTFGLLVGLVVALIVSIPFMNAPFGRIVMLMSFFVFGFLGLALSLLKSREIAAYLKQGRLVYFGEKVLDTSSLIDGRVIELVRHGFLEGTIIVPEFVVRELHTLADSYDPDKRKKGQRGLEKLNELRSIAEAQLLIDTREIQGKGVDDRLISYCLLYGGALVSTDYNLLNVAGSMGVRTLNINALQMALKEPVEAGEELELKIVRKGRARDQGVGYLPDGTMVVVEGGRGHIGETVRVVVTGMTQSPSGKVIFTRVRESA